MTFRQTPIWDAGGIDFAPLIDTLREIGYRGHVTIHQASAELGTAAAVKESARYLKGLGVGD